MRWSLNVGEPAFGLRIAARSGGSGTRARSCGRARLAGRAAGPPGRPGRLGGAGPRALGGRRSGLLGRDFPTGLAGLRRRARDRGASRRPAPDRGRQLRAGLPLCRRARSGGPPTATSSAPWTCTVARATKTRPPRARQALVLGSFLGGDPESCARTRDGQPRGFPAERLVVPGGRQPDPAERDRDRRRRRRGGRPAHPRGAVDRRSRVASRHRPSGRSVSPRSSPWSAATSRRAPASPARRPGSPSGRRSPTR